MPPARQINSRKVWKRQDVGKWFDNSPYAGAEAQNVEASPDWIVA
jgi:hypothetical protein